MATKSLDEETMKKVIRQVQLIALYFILLVCCARCLNQLIDFFFFLIFMDAG